MDPIQGRPRSVTIVGWYVIVAGIIVVSWSTILLFVQGLTLLSMIPLPAAVLKMLVFYGGIVLQVVCGIGILKGKNWARLLYACFFAVALLAGFLMRPFDFFALIPLVTFAAVVFFLFRAPAGRWFVTAEPPSRVRWFQVVGQIGRHPFIVTTVLCVLGIVPYFGSYLVYRHYNLYPDPYANQYAGSPTHNLLFAYDTTIGYIAFDFYYQVASIDMMHNNIGLSRQQSSEFRRVNGRVYRFSQDWKSRKKSIYTDDGWVAYDQE